MKKLAILGPARPRYNERVEEIRRRCRYCWSGWSYKINASKLKLLNEQIDKYGCFYIYIHDIERPKNIERFGPGTGYVEFRLRIEKFDYSDELHWSPNRECTPRRDTEQMHRFYGYIITEPEQVIPHKKYYEFINFDTGLQVSKKYPFFGNSVRHKEFIYVKDEK